MDWRHHHDAQRFLPGGVIALGVGVTMLVLSNTVSLQAARSAADVPTLSRAIENGRTQGTVGVVALSVGGRW